MGLNTSTITWTENMAFEAEVDGFKLMLDASPEHGGQEKGPRPKPLLLTSLAGCTGMDVVAILRKMREPLHYFLVRVEGDLSDGVPAVYTAMRIVFEFKKEDGLNPLSVERAVKLSQERYCGVTLMLSKSCPISYEIRYLEA